MEVDAYAMNDIEKQTNAPKQNPQGTAPRVMTDRELLLSLHQKVDRNHGDISQSPHEEIMEVDGNAMNDIEKQILYDANDFFFI